MARMYEALNDDGTNMQIMRAVDIAVCTSSGEENVRGFIDEINSRFPFADARYYQLPYNDIDRFSFSEETFDVMILCHSINNRRFSLTDVPDAIYDKFLSNASEELGEGKICVIAHDFSDSSAEIYSIVMNAFRYKQPTTFKRASLVMIGGKLSRGNLVELHDNNWTDISTFLADASKLPKSKPKSLFTMKTKTRDICLDIAIFVVILTLSLVSALFLTTISPQGYDVVIVAGFCTIVPAIGFLSICVRVTPTPTMKQTKFIVRIICVTFISVCANIYVSFALLSELRDIIALCLGCGTLIILGVGLGDGFFRISQRARAVCVLAIVLMFIVIICVEFAVGHELRELLIPVILS